MTARKPVAPFYAVAVLWLAYALVFPLYRPIHFIVLIVASVVTFAGAKALCRGEADIGESDIEKPAEEKKEEKKASATGDPEVDKMLEDGRLAIEEMKRLDISIEDAAISADIVRLGQVSNRIFEEVKADPKKGKQIRKFMDYYLPTTLKLLNAYDRAVSTGISGENVDATISKVSGMMKTIVIAFEKQLDSLYGSEALDISTDITVLETMMAREGLVGEQLKAQTFPPADDDIKLEL